MTTPTPITADEIEVLRQLEHKATQGEWRVTIADEQEAWIAAGNRRIIDCDELYEPVEANAALIAAARNAVPRLLAAIDEQAQEIARLTRERDEARAENAELRAALMPFAMLDDDVSGVPEDADVVSIYCRDVSFHFTLADCRRARATLEQGGGDER